MDPDYNIFLLTILFRDEWNLKGLREGVGKSRLESLSDSIFAFVMTLIILKVVDWIASIRVSDEDEERGMDISLHDEKGYSF
jgi:ammonia channel protein AmtB